MDGKMVVCDELEKGQSFNNRHEMKKFVAKNSKRQIDEWNFISL